MIIDRDDLKLIIQARIGRVHNGFNVSWSQVDSIEAEMINAMSQAIAGMVNKVSQINMASSVNDELSKIKTKGKK